MIETLKIFFFPFGETYTFTKVTQGNKNVFSFPTIKFIYKQENSNGIMEILHSTM